MSIWTRIAEALSAAGDSLAGLLQALSRRRATPPEKSVAFTIGMIALGAKMAKADGVVTPAEIAAFKQVFHVADKDLAAVARVFNLAKRDVAGYDFYARQIARLFRAGSPILEDVLDGLFHIAKAEGGVHPDELSFLASVAGIFGFDGLGFARIKARHLRPAADDPFLVLGLDPSASPEEIKQRYRKLVRENHPDRHMAAGVPEEMIDLATERLKRINEAYALITRGRAA
jgi:DnaJ like chaperone protein